MTVAVAMTLPNKLTIVRICLTAVIALFLFMPGLTSKVIALVAFLIASLTDWLDGYLARRWHQTSALGALLDPIADKVLVLGTFSAFAQLHIVPWWVVWLIALRELLVTGARLMATRRHIILAAEREGKQKTVSQLIAAVVVLIVVILQEMRGNAPLPVEHRVTMDVAVLGCMGFATVLTLVSGASFFWNHRKEFHAVLRA